MNDEVSPVSGGGDDHATDPEVGAVSRRRLLSAVGAAGGAGVLLGALGALGLSDGDSAETSAPFEPPRRSDFELQGRLADRHVVILGAGIAGLCCAYELGKAGHRTTVIEAAEQVGGRCRTIRSGDTVEHVGAAQQTCEFGDGRWFNPGPARIAQHHTTMAYCRELAVPLEVLVNYNDAAYIATAGGQQYRRRAVQADLDGYVSELLRKAVAIDVLDAEVPITERALLLTYLRDIAEVGRADRGYEIVPGVGAPGLVGTPDQLGTLLRLPIGQRLRFERDPDQAAVMFHPVGGMDALAVALESAIDSDVLTGHTVAAATATDDGVSVLATDSSGQERRIEADYGICCLPPHIAAGVDSNWSPSIQRALTEPVKFPTGKIGLEYGRRFWELDDRIYGGISVVDDQARVIWYPSNDYHADGGVVVGAYPFGPNAERFSTLLHQQREDLAVRIGRGLHGDAYQDDLISSVSVDWTTQPHIGAGWSQWRRFGVGYDAVLEGDNRWQFAGDWLARTSGWQHGAFESARHAVTRIHQRALAGD